MSDTTPISLESIRALVTERIGKRVTLDDETPLISGGLIDSMAIVDLILDLQTTFGVEIAVSEVQPDDFDSVSRIAETIARFR